MYAHYWCQCGCGRSRVVAQGSISVLGDRDRALGQALVVSFGAAALDRWVSRFAHGELLAADRVDGVILRTVRNGQALDSSRAGLCVLQLALGLSVLGR